MRPASGLVQQRLADLRTAGVLTADEQDGGHAQLRPQWRGDMGTGRSLEIIALTALSSIDICVWLAVDLELTPKIKWPAGECRSDPVVCPDVAHEQAVRMAEVAKALGDPVRVQLVDVLRQHAGKVCVCEVRPPRATNSSAHRTVADRAGQDAATSWRALTIAPAPPVVTDRRLWRARFCSGSEKRVVPRTRCRSGGHAGRTEPRYRNQGSPSSRVPRRLRETERNRKPRFIGLRRAQRRSIPCPDPLQSRLHRFDSGRRLSVKVPQTCHVPARRLLGAAGMKQIRLDLTRGI